MYQQINSEKVLNIAERMEALVAELRATVVATPENANTDTIGRLAVVSTDAVIIDHEGLKLRKVDHEAEKGDYVRLVGNTSSLYTNGKIYGPVLRINGEICLENDEGLTPVLYRANFNRTRETVEVFEVISAEKFEVEFTANQKRAALIEKANKFVEEASNRNYKLIGREGIWLTTENGKYEIYHKIEFIVNAKKRTIVALVKDKEDNSVVFKGIAKCDPSDVFNIWIGKAIALARALEIDVPREFLEAVQPNEIVVGQIVSNNVSADFYRVTSARMGVNDAFNLEMFEASGDVWEYARNLIIIDDTDAQYVGGEINE